MFYSHLFHRLSTLSINRFIMWTRDSLLSTTNKQTSKKGEKEIIKLEQCTTTIQRERERICLNVVPWNIFMSCSWNNRKNLLHSARAFVLSEVDVDEENGGREQTLKGTLVMQFRWASLLKRQAKPLNFCKLCREAPYLIHHRRCLLLNQLTYPHVNVLQRHSKGFCFMHEWTISFAGVGSE